MRDEPTRHPVWLSLLAAISLAMAPYAFVAAPPARVLGLPVWLWSSVGATLALSAIIAWGVWRYWRDDDA